VFNGGAAVRQDSSKNPFPLLPGDKKLSFVSPSFFGSCHDSFFEFLRRGELPLFFQSPLTAAHIASVSFDTLIETSISSAFTAALAHHTIFLSPQ